MDRTGSDLTLVCTHTGMTFLPATERSRSVVIQGPEIKVIKLLGESFQSPRKFIMPDFKICKSCNGRIDDLWVIGYQTRIMKINALICEYVCQLYAYK